MKPTTSLDIEALRTFCRAALCEDIGSGDATTMALIPTQLTVTASMRSRENCVVAGLPVVRELYHELDPTVTIEVKIDDGEACGAGDTIATIVGNARSVVTGERCALNILQRLSGIATLTHDYVTALGESRTKILDTRKTTPGLRMLEKYAVSAGGGHNHRMGLYDQIMIKDNHLHLISSEGVGGIGPAVAACSRKYPLLPIEVEVDTLEQLEEALEAKADMILLDNMSTEELREAVALRDATYSQALLEGSGGITLDRIDEIRDIGLDYISVGALTHSVNAIDIGLDIKEADHYP